MLRIIIIGAVVGFLASSLYPGPLSMGFTISTVFGVAGSFLAGFIRKMLRPGPVSPEWVFIDSIAGAMILIFIARNVL